MFSPDEFALLIEDLSLLPSISPTTRRLINRMDEPDVALSEIASLIEEDPGLASRVLKVANSPFYPYSGKVGSVREALIRLGLSSARAIILATSLFDRIRSEPGVFGLWTHSLSVAITTRRLAGLIRFPMVDEAGVAGLLHDIGKIPYYMFAPDLIRELDRDFDPAFPDHVREKDLFGLSHVEVGARLVTAWRFPLLIRQPIRWHHDPLSSPREERQMVLIVSLSDQIAQGFGLEHRELLTEGEGFLRIAGELGLSEPSLLHLMKELLRDRDMILQRAGDLL
ncbi:MAG: HDOD domain-containing protein [Nitrospirae bacterium]|jgi:putative nucleotidyltransferase with HDIG domain|nr:HDOD domain-containing protein [Nitrospirota bacterium]